jgi:hypothetical protein
VDYIWNMAGVGAKSEIDCPGDDERKKLDRSPETIIAET